MLAPKLHSIVFLFIFCHSALLAQPAILNGYHDYENLTSALRTVADEHPSLIKLESLGKTLESRDVWCLTLTGDPSTEKPAIAIVAGIEADDMASSEVALRFIESSVKAYGTIDSVTSILDQLTFYIFPRVNPDASEQLWGKSAYNRSLNSRPLDLDHDGQVNEDGYDDLNGDGLITLMRVTDPAGEWMADPKNPELLRKADPAKNQLGMYKVFTEGIDNDNDGQWNEDPVGGVNFNQNFSFNYKPFTAGAGPHPVSEIETRAVADFLFAHENIATVFNFSHNENLLSPWEAAKEGEIKPHKPIKKTLPDDAQYYAFISDQFKKTVAADALDPDRGNGNFSEWAYYHYGRWSFSAPAWWPPIVKSRDDSTTKEIEDDPLAKERRMLEWIKASKLDAFVEWDEIDHAEFPGQKVEIGGFVPGAMKNPPVDSLDALALKYATFFYRLAGYLPQLAVYLKVEPLDKQVYRVTATIKNKGYLPTNSKLGSASQWVRKVKAELILSDAQKIVSGNRFYLLPAIAGGNVYEQSWLVMGKKSGEVKVVVGSPSVGFVTEKISLK